MRNVFKSLLQNEKIRLALEWWRQATAPLTAAWGRYTAPIRIFFAPLTERWSALTAPLRTRWAAFKERYPLQGALLGWAGSFFKWGVYALLFLIITVWIGFWGLLPGREELRNIETSNATEVYTQDSVLIGKYFIENRTPITLDKISPYVVTALLATEDKRFFEHSGIDLMSWLRVFKGLASDQSLGGGSTLSQQLAKNLYPRRNYRIPGVSLLVNKIRENFISVRLENIYTKEELANLYLNTVPFGGDRFGINVASHYFFNKKPKDLTADQAATLIGMLKASTYYDPTRNPENAKRRRNLVLQQMVKNSSFTFEAKKELATVQEMIKNGKITQKDYEELSKKPIGAKRNSVDGNNDGVGTYFREYLRTEVMPDILKDRTKEDGSKYNLYRDGLKIYTTLNSKMQLYAEEAVQKHMLTLQGQFDKHWKNYKADKPWGDDKWIDEQVRRSDRWQNMEDAGMSKENMLAAFENPVKMTVFSWKNGGGDIDTTMTPIDSVRYYFCLLNCGFMAMDHHNGYVRAWVGGTNFKNFKYDHILSRRQVGSTFKPIVYAAAILDSIKPCQYFPNQLVKIKDWEPHNADETYGGWCTVTGGLTYSVNVVAAQLIEKVGIEKTIQLARKMGITSNLPREFGISLGACEVSLKEMMQVYGTMANKGTRPELVTVLKVSDRKGNVIYDYKEALLSDSKLGPHVNAMTPDQAGTMTKMLQNVVDHGTGRKLRYGFGLQADFAGKTGTTQNQSDGWFICYNPVLVTGAWVGAKSPAVRFRSMDLGQGSAMALPIVAWFWHKVANDRKLGRIYQEKFETTPAVAARFGCPFRIGISPDTLNMLMRDSTIRDSLRANGYKDLKKVAAQYFGQEPPKEDENDLDPDKYYDEQDQERKERRDERKEKRKDFFDRLLGKDEKEKKPGGGGNDKKQR